MLSNPASRAMVEACDALGVYLMDESFDMWYNRKNKYDYGCDFEKCWEQDLTELVERDYNHPSVILYSIGNEVAEPAEQKGLDYAKKQIELVHRLDPSRPVTCGVNLMIIGRAAQGKGLYQDGEQKTGGKEQKEGGNASLMFNIMASFVGTGMNKAGNSKKVDAVTSPFCDMLDIAGYNYGSGRYPLDGKAHPNRVLVGSETFPQDIYKNWQMVKKYPYLVGDFMWTSWDYLGEAGLGAWSYDGTMPFNRPYPWLLAGAGVIDINGVPDASCKYASVVWDKETQPVIGVRPFGPVGKRAGKSVWRGTNAIMSWSWQGCEGRKTTVEVYSQAPTVELLLNGKSLGKKKTKEYKALFTVAYAPGILRAVAYGADGREFGRSELRTAKNAEIHVQPEKLSAKPGEIVYVPVTIGDGETVESHADRKLTVSVEGGELLAFGSAAPRTEERYDAGEFTTYLGRALAIVKAGENCTLTVTDGRETTAVSLSVSE